MADSRHVRDRALPAFGRLAIGRRLATCSTWRQAAKGIALAWGYGTSGIWPIGNRPQDAILPHIGCATLPWAGEIVAAREEANML